MRMNAFEVQIDCRLTFRKRRLGIVFPADIDAGNA
jgi:hypothetical protein